MVLDDGLNTSGIASSRQFSVSLSSATLAPPPLATDANPYGNVEMALGASGAVHSNYASPVLVSNSNNASNSSIVYEQLLPASSTSTANLQPDADELFDSDYGGGSTRASINYEHAHSNRGSIVARSSGRRDKRNSEDHCSGSRTRAPSSLMR